MADPRRCSALSCVRVSAGRARQRRRMVSSRARTVLAPGSHAWYNSGCRARLCGRLPAWHAEECPRWLKGAVLKIARVLGALVGSNPTSSAITYVRYVYATCTTLLQAAYALCDARPDARRAASCGLRAARYWSLGFPGVRPGGLRLCARRGDRGWSSEMKEFETDGAGGERGRMQINAEPCSPHRELRHIYFLEDHPPARQRDADPSATTKAEQIMDSLPQLAE